MKLDWLDEGSLYLLLPESLLPEWHGVDSSDYGRACAASDQWLNLLPVGSGMGLVLGGDPGMALVTRGPEGDPLLVRWIYAEDEDALVRLAREGEPVSTEPELVFESPEEQWRLFDAPTRSPTPSPGGASPFRSGGCAPGPPTWKRRGTPRSSIASALPTDPLGRRPPTRTRTSRG